LLRSSGSCSDASGQPQPQRSGDGAFDLMFPKIRSIPGPLRRSCLLFCFNLKVRVNSISRSQIGFTREPKMAQMPIFDRSLGWVAGG